MGRTNPTFRDVLRAVRDQWSGYRRALRRGDQARFDTLFEYARAHADASSYLNREPAIESVLFSIALEQEARLDELEERLAELETDRSTDGAAE